MSDIVGFNTVKNYTENTCKNCRECHDESKNYRRESGKEGLPAFDDWHISGNSKGTSQPMSTAPPNKVSLSDNFEFINEFEASNLCISWLYDMVPHKKEFKGLRVALIMIA